MKLYFAGSIRGGRADVLLYRDLIAYLNRVGTVLTEHVGDTALTEEGGDGPDDVSIYLRDMEWLDESHAVIAEVTQPSLGVGYELGAAVALGKPVLALFRPSSGRVLSAMVTGCRDITVAEYETLDGAIRAVDGFLAALPKE
jgi:nucleoside 2-deoxyribosyltransferase